MPPAQAATRGVIGVAATPAVTLGEGDTPLVRSRWIGPHLGLDRLWFKVEQCNPTGSYKDRFAARLVSLMVERGQTLCLGTSSGNTGAAVAAYAAAAGVRCLLCVPANAPAAKLAQAQAYGARLLRVRDMLGTAPALRRLVDRLRAVASRRGLPLGISAYACAPEAMAGIEPLSGEITRVLGRAPDRVFVPVGGGGLLTAVWRGFGGEASGGPRVHAVQPAGNDTLVGALHAGETRAREVASTTRISGLAVPLDLDATAALRAVRAAGGDGHLVEDEWVQEVQTVLARREGLWVEPAGAASVAGLWRAAQTGYVGRGEVVVCLLTGHGLKAPPAQPPDPECSAVVSVDEIDEALLLGLAHGG
jgi:threonine synthase